MRKGRATNRENVAWMFECPYLSQFMRFSLVEQSRRSPLPPSPLPVNSNHDDLPEVETNRRKSMDVVAGCQIRGTRRHDAEGRNHEERRECGGGKVDDEELKGNPRRLCKEPNRRTFHRGIGGGINNFDFRFLFTDFSSCSLGFWRFSELSGGIQWLEFWVVLCILLS